MLHVLNRFHYDMQTMFFILVFGFRFFSLYIIFQILDFTLSSFILGNPLYRVDLKIFPFERYFVTLVFISWIKFCILLYCIVLYCINCIVWSLVLSLGDVDKCDWHLNSETANVPSFWYFRWLLLPFQ